ncbi:MAG: glycogen synthase GlgA [Nitrospirae bacterium]|nr:glycogen synthase GlgA [Nitrospirota bacterium]
MRILIATPEAVPYVKTGGLADVTGALLKEFRKRNDDVSLVLPLYKAIKKKFRLFRTGKSFTFWMGDSPVSGEIWTSHPSSSPEAYFVACDGLYGRQELYGSPAGDYADNALRFAFFSRAVPELCCLMNIKPDIIHCNDWQTGMAPLYLRTLYRNKVHFRKTATLFTIHNLGYQGLFHESHMKYTGLGRDYFTPETLEFHGMVNFMKAGLISADLLSTVSLTYAREILEPENGFGLDGVLRKRRDDLFGIVNGIDYEEWDPARDTFIPANFSLDDLRGKEECRRRLIKEAGLNGGARPVIGVVSRLSSQKGLDLIAGSIEDLVSMGAQVVIVGSGDDYYQKLLTDISAKHKGRVSVRVGFEESLAHLIYAGSDLFLMPSRYEPCGLGQLIALRYGTIPVVRKTGGLADTIEDYDHLLSEGTGFYFSDYSPAALRDAVKRAFCVLVDDRKRKDMIRRAMKTDFSWKRSADQYVRLYGRAAKKVRG